MIVYYKVLDNRHKWRTIHLDIKYLTAPVRYLTGAAFRDDHVLSLKATFVFFLAYLWSNKLWSVSVTSAH